MSRVPFFVAHRPHVASARSLVLRRVLLGRVHLHRARILLHAGIRRGRSRRRCHRRSCGGIRRRRGRVFLRFARCKHERSSSEDGKALHLQSPCGGQWLINLRPCTRAAMQGTSGTYSTPCDRPVKVSRVTHPASSVRSAPISRTRPSRGIHHSTGRLIAARRGPRRRFVTDLTLSISNACPCTDRRSNSRTAIRAGLWLPTHAIDMLQSIPPAHHPRVMS